MLSLLNECKADYEVVDVMDELYNPGLRDAIKEFSVWPTIPQAMSSGPELPDFLSPVRCTRFT